MRHKLLLLVAAAALSALPLLGAASGADDVQVIEPYVRAMPPGQPNTAAFMRLQNRGERNHALVDATSPASEIVELHTHVEEGGMMRMRRIERIDIPAQGEAVLQPGGLHIMLIGLKQPLSPGDTVPITLIYADGSTLDIEPEARHIVRHMRH
jgi:periplasmic copper chaperone A